MTLQQKIDLLDYPPTHNYKLETLEPTGSLRKRLLLMPQSFFTGNTFLDIGCNKGFFSLLAAKNCHYVEAFDNDIKYVKLCEELGINVSLNSFRNYNPNQKFDRIMLGNVMHYMYRECGDWSFIIKLAAISTDLVLIEGPTGMNCKIMKDAIPKHLRKNFNDVAFRAIMDRFFTLISICNSPSQGRYIMLFKRRKVNTISFMPHDGVEILKQDKESTVYKSGEKIVKIQVLYRSVKDEIKIFISSYSPVSNGLEMFVYNYGKYQGWVENYSNLKKLKPFTRQKEVLYKLCEHNIYLAKLGYTEMDMGISNFWPNLIMYDKGGIRHIQDIPNKAIDDIEKGYFFTMFRNQFDININFGDIQKALLTRDSFEIEKLYRNLDIHKEKIDKKLSWFAKNKNLLANILRKN